MTLQVVMNGMARFFRERGSSTARLDAELILAHVLEVGRIDLYSDFDRPVTEEELSRIRPLMVARSQGKPIAQITGEKEFFSLDFVVDGHVLTPRPETEDLVETALARAKAMPDQVLAVDFGTGSGNIAVAFARYCPTSRVIAVERSLSALAVAATNVKRHDLGARVQLVAADGLSTLDSPGLAGKVDLLLSNPPYVAKSDANQVEEGVRRFEPEMAVFAGKDAYRYYRHLAAAGRRLLSERGALVVEVGAGMANRVQEILVDEGGLRRGAIKKDLAGIPRVVVANAAHS